MSTQTMPDLWKAIFTVHGANCPITISPHPVSLFCRAPSFRIRRNVGDLCSSLANTQSWHAEVGQCEGACVCAWECVHLLASERALRACPFARARACARVYVLTLKSSLMSYTHRTELRNNNDSRVVPSLTDDRRRRNDRKVDFCPRPRFC